MRNILKSYKEQLLSNRKESNFRKIAEDLSDELLEYESYPNEYIDFLVDILSEKELYDNKGLYYFLAELGVDTDILTEVQMQCIASVIVENYQQYKDGMLCFTACDFIARYYPEAQAREILEELANIEPNKSDELQGFAKEGINIINTDKLLSADSSRAH